jgi:hypothetical protein
VVKLPNCKEEESVRISMHDDSTDTLSRCVRILTSTFAAYTSSFSTSSSSPSHFPGWLR